MTWTPECDVSASTVPEPAAARGPVDAFFVSALALGLARSGLDEPACLTELTSLADPSLLHEARELLTELSHHPAPVVGRARALLEAAIRQTQTP